MRRTVLAAGLACLLLCGCAAKDTPRQQESFSDIGNVQATAKPEATPAFTGYPQGERTPLQIERGYVESTEGYILYPKVISGDHAQKMNDATCAAIAGRAAAQDTQVFTEYRIEHNAEGLFSIIIYLRDLHTDKMLEELPLTFDCADGRLCDLAYFFDRQNDAWRSAISAMVTKKAEENGVALLRSLPPVEDTRAYYLSGDSLVIQYRLYEISTYSAGWPEFDIPVTELQAYLAPESPLLRMVRDDAV